MAKLVTYRCPDCKGTFDYLHHPSTDPGPEYCELCNAFVGDDRQQEPVLHIKIGTAKNKVGDKLYRQFEKSSDARIEAAVEIGGGDKSDYGNMKMTDMPDNTRAGDNYSKSVTQAVHNLTHIRGQKVCEAPSMQGGGKDSAQAKAWAGETTHGVNALTTRKVMEAMPHGDLAARVTHAGRMGKG